MTWKDRLIIEAENIINHGEGKLEMLVVPTGEDKMKIRIDCGKSWRFEVAKGKDD